MPYSISRIWFVIAALVLTLDSASPVKAAPAATPIPLIQTDQEQLELVRARYHQRKEQVIHFVAALGVLSAFGLVCALWAYCDCRSVLLWFFLGFALNFAAVLLIFVVRRRNRGRKRYRRVISYWHVSR